MSTQPGRATSPLGLALGRIPSGLYILTLRQGAGVTGMLASWVQQAGFEPPMVTVAVRRDRFVADWLSNARRYTLNQIPTGAKSLVRHFARGFEPEAEAFAGLEIRHELPSAGPVLADALAYLDIELSGSLDSGDHRVFVGEVVAGAIIKPEADPMIHVRHSGFHY